MQLPQLLQNYVNGLVALVSLRVLQFRSVQFNFVITSMSESHYSPKHLEGTIQITRVFEVPHRGFGWRAAVRESTIYGHLLINFGTRR